MLVFQLDIWLYQSSDNQSQCLAAPQAPLLNYKHRLDDFRKLFKELPETERLIGGEFGLPSLMPLMFLPII